MKLIQFEGGFVEVITYCNLHAHEIECERNIVEHEVHGNDDRGYARDLGNFFEKRS